MKNFKSALLNSRLQIGSWITIGNTSVAENMCDANFDWLTIDIEHSVINISDVQKLVSLIQLKGITPLVRVSANDATLIKRVMDTGSHGVIVPLINTKLDAENAVKAVKYPPEGLRGVGLARAQGFGFSFEEYKKWISKNSIIIAQIEHINAINNLGEILKVKGIDGTIIGPYDLSGSIGYPGEFNRLEVKKAIQYYENTCIKYKKPMGFHIVQPKLKLVKEYVNKGYSLLAVGLDTLYLGSKCREIVQGIKKDKMRRK